MKYTNLMNYSMNLKRLRSFPLLIVIVTTIVFIILNAPVIEWNKSISFPDFMSSFETWALLKEKQLENLTIYLVSFQKFFFHFHLMMFIVDLGDLEKIFL